MGCDEAGGGAVMNGGEKREEEGREGRGRVVSGERGLRGGWGRWGAAMNGEEGGEGSVRWRRRKLMRRKR